MNEFDALQKTGMPIDWATLYAGWGSFVRTEQLQNYALAEIGYSPGTEFALVSSLAFADDRDFWTITASLEQLAPNAPEIKRRAARVWQWVTLLLLVEALEEELEEGIKAGSPAENDSWLEFTLYDVWSDLRDFWQDREFDADRLFSVQDWGPIAEEGGVAWARQVLAEHRRFLAQEEAELRQEQTRP